MSPETVRITPSPQTLRRNRMLLIGGIVTVLPAAAFAPGLLSSQQPRTPLLAAVDDMAAEAKPHADINEGAVEAATGIRAPSAFVAGANLQIAAAAPADDLSALLIDTSRIPEEDAASFSTECSASGLESEAIRYFNGRPVRPVRRLAMLVTAYSPDAASCGESADGITASGYSVWTNGMKLVAADTSILPFGSLISVPGYDEGNIVPVLDRGGAIKGNRLDVLYPTHEQATVWGTQRLEVTVWEYADGQPSDFEIRYNSASAVR